MKTAIKTLLLMLLTFPVFAQHQSGLIRGTVISAEDQMPLPGININIKGSSEGTVTDIDGKYELAVNDKNGTLIFSFIGFQTFEIKIGGRTIIDVQLHPDVQQLSEVVVAGYHKRSIRTAVKAIFYNEQDLGDEYYTPHNTEEYDAIHENEFVSPMDHPLSTFSIDVDNASYSNMRRFLNTGQKPPVDAVRIEELINYFNYDYAGPTENHPYSIHTELSTAPWNHKNMLLKIGLKARNLPIEALPPNNLVFLIDVSGSMNVANKLPLLKQSFKLLVEELRPEDKVAIVVYAGAAGVVLPSTNNKSEIIKAIDRLEAGGSTAGGQGLELAYQLAEENFMEDGNNRIILASDGDFNVGPSSNAAMERLIEKKRDGGVYLSVLGFGMGNYKDSKMEILADKGNGNYAYIDNLREARKTLVDEMAGTLLVVAKDVKLQLEFNPQLVKGYRLIGYENRKLNKEDFNNDKKDAGDLGAGHTVTALYEIITHNNDDMLMPSVDTLKYQKNKVVFVKSNELLTIKSRYKLPGEETSKKLELVVLNDPIENPSIDFRWATAVAAFGMLLRDSEFINNFTYEEALLLARGARGSDENGYRIEFINIIQSGKLLAQE